MASSTNRYSRLEILHNIGKETMKKIRSLSVAIIGLGGTGSLSADLFCRAGIRKLLLVDRDFVDLTNIHRQILFSENDIGRRKADAALEKLSGINSDVSCEAMFTTFDAGNALDITKRCDLVIDGTDNLTTRFIINDACNYNNVPWVFTSAVETYGQVKLIRPGISACFACFGPAKLVGYPTCEQVGVLSSVPNMISSLAFSEAIRMIADKNNGRFLYHVETWPPSIDKIEISRKNDCRSCVRHEYDYLTEKYRDLGRTALI